MRDDFILGHALRQHLRAEQLDLWDQFTALDASCGQILLDDEHWDLVLLDEIDDVVVYAWRLGLLPHTDAEPRVRPDPRPRNSGGARRDHPTLSPISAGLGRGGPVDCGF